MTKKFMSLFAVAAFSLTSAAWAQTPAGGGSAEGNVNNPGSVKSNSEKGVSESAPTTGTDATTAPPASSATGGGTEGNMKNPGSVKSDSEKK